MTHSIILRKPRSFLRFAVFAIASSMLVPLASAALSINFGSTTPLGVSETAGVVAKGYWNNAAGASSASALKLADDTGAATNAAVSWKADGVWNTPVADIQGNNRMMRGYLDTPNGNPVTVSLSGLASGTYNIYVYVDGDNSTAARAANYQISGQGVTTTSISLTDPPNTSFSGNFIQANSGSGNYVLFSNITIASGAILTATPGASTSAPRAPVNGIQIVPVSGPGPDFTIATTSSSQTVTLGSATTYSVTAGAVNGFVGTIGLSVSGLPAGAGASFSPAAIGAGGTSTLTVTTIGSTPPGTSELTITGVSGSLSHSVKTALIVTTATSPTALSIDFVGTGNSLTANEVAGVIPKSNWNSASGAASTTPLNLKNEAGSATGATVTWASDNEWRTPVADVAGNNRMMSGYLDNGQGNPSTVRLAGITPGNYDILVYSDGDNPSTSRTGSYQISGSGIATRTLSVTDTQNTTFSGAFIASSNATGNYVIFNGVTISSGFTLTGTPGATGDVPRAPINGIQIVPAGAASSNVVPPLSTPTLSIVTATIPGGQAGIQYSSTLTATGGTTPYNWGISAGTLPTGLALSTSSGNISGTPAAGSYSFSVRVRDNSGQEATNAYSVSIQPAASTSPAPSTSPVASTYYVAANGNDAWSGQLPSPNGTNTDGPFLTLRRAQTAMQSSTRKAATIRGGTYSVASGMSFSASDNGETWIAYPGETAVLDGGGQGSIRIGNASRMTFEGLTLRNMGADSFFIDYGDAFTFRSNVFTNCRLGCITGNFLTNSVLDGNTIDGQSPGNPAGNTGNAYSAIHLYGTSSNNRITHNLIKNTEGGGIGLNNSPTQGGCSNNIIDRNLLQNVDTNVVDFGAIYIYDPSHGGVGNQITNNVVDVYGGPNGVANEVKGIYLDDLTSNVLVSGNLVRNGGAWAFMIHGGDRNTVTNNVWDLSSSGTLLAFYQSSPFGSHGMTSNVFTKNLVYSGSTYPSSLYLIYKGAGDAPLAPSNNLYHSATGAAIPNTGMVDSNRILANPLFAAPSTGNYAMPASSPAYTTVGFAPLPTDQGPLPR